MGLAYVASFHFTAGSVQYVSRFMETADYYKACKAAGSCKAVPKTATGMTCPVTFTHINGSLLATTEFEGHTELDSNTLAVIESPFQFGDSLPVNAAAPSHDVLTSDGVLIHHVVDLMRIKPINTVYQIAPGEKTRTVLAKIKADDPGLGPLANRYSHQVLATQEWYVIFEGPCFGAFGVWQWKPEAGTRVRLVNRKTGDQKVYHISTNYFTTHQINAFHDGDDLVADLVSSDCGCAKDVANFKLSTLTVDSSPMNYSATTTIIRLRMPLSKPGSTVTPTRIVSADVQGMEFPVVSKVGLPYNYTYMVKLSGPSAAWYDQVIKVNMGTGAVEYFTQPNTYFGEAVFTPKPGSKFEDDGVVLAVGLDVSKNESNLVILDARSWKLISQAKLPEVLPFQYHSRFFPNEGVRDMKRHTIASIV
jgi:beta-carotene 15,15'-monooxygenase